MSTKITKFKEGKGDTLVIWIKNIIRKDKDKDASYTTAY
jgi:hypothetical protein